MALLARAAAGLGLVGSRAFRCSPYTTLPWAKHAAAAWWPCARHHGLVPGVSAASAASAAAARPAAANTVPTPQRRAVHGSAAARRPHKAAAAHLDEPFAPRLFDALRLATFSEAELRAAFDKYDTDGDGNLDRGEITRLVHDICRVQHPCPAGTDDSEQVTEDTDRLLAKWDDDGDGLVSRAEFEAHVREHAEKLDPRVWPIAGCMLATGVSVGVIIPVMPVLVQDMGLSTADFGLVVAAFGASKLLGNIPPVKVLQNTKAPCCKAIA